jgi:hypothetical protein
MKPPNAVLHELLTIECGRSKPDLIRFETEVAVLIDHVSLTRTGKTKIAQTFALANYFDFAPELGMSQRAAVLQI